MEYATIIAFLGSTGGAVFLTHLFTKKKQQAETQSLTSRVYIDIIQTMRVEISRLRERISDLETEVKQLKSTSGCKPKPFLRKV